MRILGLVSSYRKAGNTARIAQMVGAHLEAIAARHDEPLEFETLYLGHMDIQTCRGCRTCFDRGEEMCPLKDDLLAIKARMDTADGIILASPVYVNDVNGIAKNWLDRLAYVCHRPAFGGKSAYLIATVADSPTSHTLRTMNVALRTWGFHIVGQAGYKMGALMPQSELESRYQGKAAKVAKTLFEAISQRAVEHPSFLSLTIFRIQQLSWRQKAPPGSLDYAYWEGQGWLDPRREFYIEHRANRVKVALARLAGAVLARFVM
jgi:multimeric flavodoxin WrbA